MKESNLFTRVLPEYLFKKSNIVKIVLFTAFFASIFINTSPSAQEPGIATCQNFISSYILV